MRPLIDSSQKRPESLIIMALTLESYMEAEGLPEAKRQLLREQARHSVSCYGLNGEHLQNAFDKENLLAVIGQMKRVVVDSNSAWKHEASKAENFDKAFIIGQTVTEEPDNLKGVFFGRSTEISNNNLFEFGMHEINGVPYLELGRLDPHFRLVFDEQGLDEESRPRASRTDAEFLA